MPIPTHAHAIAVLQSGAKIFSLQVSTTILGTNGILESAEQEAMRWILLKCDTDRFRVINLSIGKDARNAPIEEDDIIMCDLMDQVVEKCGTIFVAAAGGSGA